MVVESDFEHTRKEIAVLDHTSALGGFDYRAVFRRHFKKLLVGRLLVLYAAQQPAAVSAHLAGVERNALFLCHSERNGLELVQEFLAAERSAADSDSAEHFRLVAHAYLTKLYANLEDTCKALYKLPEINALGGGVEEQHL